MKSKVDRIGDVFEEQIKEVIDSVRLAELDAGNAATAAGLARLRDTIAARAKFRVTGYTYRRLEVSDIIRGHKRAWSES